MNTQENNKLIAEFMGISIDGEFAYIEDEGSPLEEVMPINKLNYHTSWNWLMPVVENCLERLDVRDRSADEIKRQLLVCNRIGVHTAVVEFINQYNKTK